MAHDTPLPPAILDEGATSAESIREFVEAALAQAAKRGEYPVWQLPDPTSSDPAYLRWRRAALLLLLALPGRVEVDVTAEREVQGLQAPPPFDVDEILRLVEGQPWYRFAEHGIHPRSVFVDWENYYWDEPCIVMFEPKAQGQTSWGAFVIANLSDRPYPVTDGSIVVASDWPAGPEDPTSDNDLLPPMTTIWLAAK